MATKTESAQNFVPIKEVRDSVVLLKDGSMRAVMLASSLNFALKSEDEQNAIILQFQNFLNSLEFPLQIFVQSRDLDIRPYIALLEERHGAQTDNLLKIQTREYINFIRGFVENVNIMSKSFFIVVPYDPSVIERRGGVAGFLGRKKSTEKSATQEKMGRFEEQRSQIEQRISVVEAGLGRVGIRVAQLGTEELVELYYKLFNPGELGKPLPVENR